MNIMGSQEGRDNGKGCEVLFSKFLFRTSLLDGCKVTMTPTSKAELLLLASTITNVDELRQEQYNVCIPAIGNNVPPGPAERTRITLEQGKL